VKKTLPTLALLLLLTACGAPATPVTPPVTPQETETTYRSEINVAITAQPPALDPNVTVSSVALDTAANIYESLYTLDSDFQPVPMLAKSVELSTDGLVYTFPLREGVKFHNGEEMTATDVAASLNRWLTLSSRAKTLLAGAEFTEIDPYTVQLSLVEPAADALIVMATHSQFPAVMPASLALDAPEEGVTEYIGTGPYQFVEWLPDQYIHLTRFADYQSLDAHPSGFSGGKEAATADLYFRFVADTATRVAGVKTGAYDIADSIPTENYAELIEDDAVNVYTKNSGALTAFFNTRGGLLADAGLRQAVLAAMNNEDIMLAAFGTPELYSLHPGYLNPTQVQWATEVGDAYYNQNDPEKAQALLAEAGYNGETLRLLTTQDYAEMYNATVVLQEQLRQVGFETEIVAFDFATFMERKNDYSAWEIFIASTGYQLTPPQILALSPEFAGLNQPEIPAMIAAIRQAPEQGEALAAWEALQLYLYEFGAGSVIGHYAALVATGSTVEGFEAFLAPIVWNVRIPE
jgi:peptide/nickel transport system substrate-binding protein